MVLKFRMMPQWLSSLSRQQWDTAKQQEEYSGTLQESQGRSFSNYGISLKQTETVFCLHDPKSEWINSPTAKKYVEITKHKKKKKKKKKKKFQ